MSRKHPSPFCPQYFSGLPCPQRTLYTKPPTVASIRTVHDWAPEISLLKSTLPEMWTSEEAILYRWIDYLRSGEFLQELGFHMNTNRPLQ